MIDLVRHYFAGVDGEDFAAIGATLADDCVFTVETHGVRLQGHTAIEGMFRRLWDAHESVEHRDFVYVADSGDGRIAAQFTVVNTHRDGALTHKSNCNFFEIRDGRFKSVAIYMAGENTLSSG